MGRHRTKASGCVRQPGDGLHQTKRRALASRPPKSQRPFQAQRLPTAETPTFQYRLAASLLLGGRLGSSDKAFAVHPALDTDAARPARGSGNSGPPANTDAARSRCAKLTASTCGNRVGVPRQGSGGSTADHRSGDGSASLEPSPTANWSCSPRSEAQWLGLQGAMWPPRAECDRASTSPTRCPSVPQTALGQDPSSMPASGAITRRSAP